MTEPEELEALVRTALAREADRVPLPTPEWDPSIALRTTARRAGARSRSSPRAGRSRRWLAHVAVAALAGTAIVGVVVAGGDGSDDDRLAQAPIDRGATTVTEQQASTTTVSSYGTGTTIGEPSTTTVLGPPVTLPPMPGGGRGTPMTVPDLPPTYYRVAPDLDIGWVDTGGAPRVCWQTVVVEGCTPEPAAGGNALVEAIAGSSEHTVVLVVPEPGGSRPGAVVADVAGRGEVTAVVEWDDEVQVGVARIDAAVEQVDIVRR